LIRKYLIKIKADLREQVSYFAKLRRLDLRLQGLTFACTFAYTKITAKPTNQSTVKNACGVQKWVALYKNLTRFVGLLK